MRTGVNPQKSEDYLVLKKNHRVVMVVFIPELSGYYEDMLEILKVSINSLYATIPNTSAITVVDNGSCDEVREYLYKLYREKVIDSLQMHQENIGKIDAQIGAARTSREPLITLTDCDILFRPEWVSETFSVFNNFSSVGSVSPLPPRKAHTYYTVTAQEKILTGSYQLQFEPIPENFKDYNLFLKSINWHLEKDENGLWPIIRKNGKSAILGSDHQVITLRRDILFNTTPATPSLTKVGKESEREYVDLAIDLNGGLRLSTCRYFANHMGNQLEPWMQKEVEKFQKNSKSLKLNLKPELTYKQKNPLSYKIKKKLLKKLFSFKIPKQIT